MFRCVPTIIGSKKIAFPIYVMFLPGTHRNTPRKTA
nr:MAG TPA: hypothetical protein [Caudoviricetes sp.]